MTRRRKHQRRQNTGPLRKRNLQSGRPAPKGERVQRRGGAKWAGPGPRHSAETLLLHPIVSADISNMLLRFNANLQRKPAFKKLLMRIIRAWIMSYRVFLWLRDAAKHVRTSASAVSVRQTSAHVLNLQPFPSNLGRNRMQI